MPFSYHPAGATDHWLNLRRLVASRWLVLATTALFVMIVPGVLDVPLPQWPLLGIIAAGALFNLVVGWRLPQSSTADDAEFARQLLFDIALLSALLFFSGGATNPLVSLLLPPVAIAALALPGRFVVLVGSVAILAYSLLMVEYLPLAIADATRATRLHLIGMWLTFTVSAAMIGWLILRMTRLIRERDAALAAAREQALRDERITAMGTLAAGAAHELGTPLATMALVAGEMAHDATLSPESRADVALLRQQIGICKDIVGSLARRADAERLENPPQQPVDRWLDSLRQRWHAVRPQAASRLMLGSDRPAPEIAADPRLEQALLNLLNNAANASAQPLEIRLAWSSTGIDIEIRDQGPGFPEPVLALSGRSELPPHEAGSGVGLMLTRSAIEQLGGRLILLNPDDGGALARIELPRTPR